MRLIDVEQVFCADCEDRDRCGSPDVFCDVRGMPTIDAVPVVRCKDCKYIRPEVDAYTHEVVGYWCSLLDIGSVQEEHFCSYGERKDGGG